MKWKILSLFIIAIVFLIPVNAATTTIGFKEQYQDWRGMTHDFNAQNLARYPYFDRTDDGHYWYFNSSGDLVVIPKEFDIEAGIKTVSPSMTFPKSTLASRMVNVNQTIGYLVFPYTLSRIKDFADEHNIYFGRWHWDNGLTISDTNGSTLGQEYYNLRVVDDEIRLYFNKTEANKNLSGNITFRMNSWTIDNSTFWSTQDCGDGYWSAYGGGSCGTPLNSSIHANLSGYWDMESTIGTIEHGINRYGRFPNSTIAGTWNGNTTLNYTSGQLWGNAVNLDGINDYIVVNLSNSLNFNGTDKISESILIKVNALDGNQYLIARHRDGTDAQGSLLLTALNKVRFLITTTTGFTSLISPTSVNTNEWAYTASLYDGSKSDIYINNTLDATTPTTGTINVSRYTLNDIGGLDATGFFNGSIDEVILDSSGLPVFSNSTYSTVWNKTFLNNSAPNQHIVTAVKFNIYNVNVQNNVANISVRETGTTTWTQIATNYSGDNTTWINGTWWQNTDFAVNVSGNGSSRAFIISMTYDEMHVPVEITGYVNNTLGAFVDGALVTINGASTLSRHTYLPVNTDLCSFNHTTNQCDGTRQGNTTYIASSNIQLIVFAHANSAGQNSQVIVNIDGTNVTYISGKPLGAPPEENYKPQAILIPQYANYTVYFANFHHYEWREYPLVHGYYNLTSEAGIQNVLVQQVGYANFTGTLNASADMSYNVTLSESFGNSIITAPGFEGIGILFIFGMIYYYRRMRR